MTISTLNEFTISATIQVDTIVFATDAANSGLYASATSGSSKALIWACTTSHQGLFRSSLLLPVQWWG